MQYSGERSGELSRRRFLTGLGAAAAGVLVPARVVLARTPRQRTVVLTVTATHTGEYLYLPFQVPGGVSKIEANLTKDREETKVGVGIFDQRGDSYGSPGFRGVYGEERGRFFLSAGHSSLAFTPGRIERGGWTVIVPVFQAAGPTKIRVEITLSFGKRGRVASIGPEPGTVKAKSGWYRGDLHCHTVHSSDANASGSALTPSGWAQTAGRLGLDFISLTDHNVVTQNRHLAADSANTGVLLLGGEEMTNWFHGHATVTGLDPGIHLDWRQRPEGVPLDRPQEARIGAFIRRARDLGTYTAAAHPFAGPIAWQFFADAATDPSLLPDGLEVWNGPFQPDDETTLKKWDELLGRGIKIWANGGSDTHGIENNGGVSPGHPTNVVHADELSKPAILHALKNGRNFITRLPDGAELYLSAEGPGGQRQIVGGSIHGNASDIVRFTVLVRKGIGNNLILLRDGEPVQVTPITSGEQTVTLVQPVGTGGYIRAELRGQADASQTNPRADREGMEALTNPIFLVNGPVPDGNTPLVAPPPES